MRRTQIPRRCGGGASATTLISGEPLVVGGQRHGRDGHQPRARRCRPGRAQRTANGGGAAQPGITGHDQPPIAITNCPQRRHYLSITSRTAPTMSMVDLEPAGGGAETYVSSVDQRHACEARARGYAALGDAAGAAVAGAASWPSRAGSAPRRAWWARPAAALGEARPVPRAPGAAGVWRDAAPACRAAELDHRRAAALAVGGWQRHDRLAHGRAPSGGDIFVAFARRAVYLRRRTAPAACECCRRRMSPVEADGLRCAWPHQPT